MAQVSDFTAADAALLDLEAALDTIESTAAGEVQTGQAYRERYARTKRAAERLAALTAAPNGYNRVKRLVERF